MSSKNIAVVFGGISSEHKISLLSAVNIINGLACLKNYKILPIGIDQKGRWFLFQNKNYILHSDDPKKISLSKTGIPITLGPGCSKRIVFLDNAKLGPRVDVLFPVLHGSFGEDGTIQGLAEMAGIPCVGPGVLGSAIGMDKDVTKRLLRNANIPVADFVTLQKSISKSISFTKLKKDFGIPFFVKPATSGSSVGVHKVRTEKEFLSALADAFQYSKKVLVEKMVVGKEIECSVLGNDDPIVSLPGEVVPSHDFYSYDAKYLDSKGATYSIPARLPKATIKMIQFIAKKTYLTLEESGMSRVDGFLLNDGSFIVNEVNTIPGFTSISMYPKLWEVSGLSYTALLDRLIYLACELKQT